MKKICPKRSRKIFGLPLVKGFVWCFACLLILFLACSPALASTPQSTDTSKPNTIWVLFCAVLVVLMQLGFALLECGLVESKNAVSIMYKNTMGFCVGFVGFALIGYWIMCNGWPLLRSNTFNGYNPLAHPFADFIYQAVFAVTAATICSGAIASRMNLNAYLVLTFIMTGFVYPFFAHYLWVADSWINPIDSFHDFAGSVVVHSVGGAAALAQAIVLGPRKDRNVGAHNVPLASAGMFLLLIGWYGFNMGSTREDITTLAGRTEISLVAVNTTLAAVTGGISALYFGRLWHFPALSLSINGVLGGAVAITASSNSAEPYQAILFGMSAGLIVVWWISIFSKRSIINRRLDDPVSAFPVHGLCGPLGGLLVGFTNANFEVYHQVLISISTPLIVFIVFWLITRVYKMLTENIAVPRSFRLRVSDDVEERGLDITELKEPAYDFKIAPLSPQTIKDQLEVVLAEYPWARRDKVAEIYDEVAEYKVRELSYTDAPFDARFSIWLGNLLKISEYYGSTYGTLEALEPNPSEIKERLKRAITNLRGYAQHEGIETKRKVFEEQFNKVLEETKSLLKVLGIHASAEWASRNAILKTENRISELKSKLDSQEIEISSQKQIIDKHNQRIRSQQKEFDDQKNQINQMSAQIVLLKVEIQTAKESNAKLEQLVNTLRKIVSIQEPGKS